MLPQSLFNTHVALIVTNLPPPRSIANAITDILPAAIIEIHYGLQEILIRQSAICLLMSGMLVDVFKTYLCCLTFNHPQFVIDLQTH